MTPAFHTILAEDYILACACSQKKVMPSVLADSEDQEKFSCFMYSILVFLKDPIRITEFFFVIEF